MRRSKEQEADMVQFWKDVAERVSLLELSNCLEFIHFRRHPITLGHLG